MAASDNSDDKYCFSIKTDPLNPIECSFEKYAHNKNISFKEKDQIYKFFTENDVMKFEVIENFYSDLTKINIGNQITNEVFSHTIP